MNCHIEWYDFLTPKSTSSREHFGKVAKKFKVRREKFFQIGLRMG
jgi:hypothetical protein